MHDPPGEFEPANLYYERITQGTVVDPVVQPTTWYAQ